MICPLCNSNNNITIEKIKTNKIVELWRRRNVDVAELFNDKNILEKIICNNCGLEYFNPFISGDNKFYSKLGEENWYYLHEDKTEFEYSCKYIKKDNSILDIGSGRGAFTKYIDKNIKYTGLELSSKAVEFAQNEGINVIEKTIEEYSLDNKNIHDVVVSFQVLEHITNIDSFIKSSIETIKDKGLLIIAVPNNKSFIRNAQNNLLNLPPHHLLHWNEQSLKYIAKKYNLKIVDIYKEKVTNVHKTWYYSIQISKVIQIIFGMKVESINITIFNKIIQKFSSVFSRLVRYTNIHSDKDGHTIAIVLKKNV